MHSGRYFGRVHRREGGVGIAGEFRIRCGGARGEGDEESEQEGKEFIVSHGGQSWGAGGFRREKISIAEEKFGI